MRDKILGVIGGMGPLASDIFYKDIIENTKAEKDQDHIDMIILNHASMPDRTEAIKSGHLDDIFRELEDDFRILKAAGATVAAFTCNTVHVLYDRISKMTDIPVLNMPDEAAAFAAKEFGSGARIGILATDGSRESGVYHKALEKYDLIPVDVSEENQKRVMNMIYECVKKGNPINEEDVAVVTGELSDCSCVILGCTELSAVREETFSSNWYIDPMEITARSAIKAVGGRIVED